MNLDHQLASHEHPNVRRSSMRDRESNVVAPLALRHAGNAMTLQIASISRIPKVLRELGVDPRHVCAAAGFDYALFDDSGNVTTFREVGRLLRVCTEKTACPHFGLLQGQKSGLDCMGIVGLLAKYSPDVRTALETLARYTHLLNRGAVIDLETTGHSAVLSYAILALDAEATDQMADAALGAMFNVMIALCGPDWKPVDVWLGHRKPVDVAPFRKIFQAPLRFDSDQNAIVFAASWLDRPLPSAEPELSRLLREKVAALEAQSRDQFTDQVRSVLRSGLLNDRGSADQVASALCMHSRTLHRRLAAAGTNFRTLVDECRYGIARQMLENTKSDVGNIAYLLDYADTSAFARAFRRWSGTTPSRWRTRDERNLSATGD